jgi:hypothetical protein
MLYSWEPIVVLGSWAPSVSVLYTAVVILVNLIIFQFEAHSRRIGELEERIAVLRREINGKMENCAMNT